MIVLIFHLSFTTIGVLFDAGMLQKQELANRTKQSEASDAASNAQLSDSRTKGGNSSRAKGPRRNSSSIISTNSDISEQHAEVLAGTGMCKIDMWNSSCKREIR